MGNIDRRFVPLRSQLHPVGLNTGNRAPTSDEQGSALVTVIASIFLVGALITSMVSMTLYSAGRAGATRASAEATAAAEGGLENAARYLFDAENPAQCQDYLGIEAGTGLTYRIDAISFKEKGASNFRECDSGEIPKTADSVKILASGFAEVSNYRNSSRNTTRMERTFERPKSLNLDAALFAGAYLSPENGAISVADQAGNPGDVISRGQMYCKAGNPSKYTGNVYALNGFQAQNDCVIEGDLYVRGDISIHTQLTVLGDTYIDGKLTISNPGDFRKKVFINGDLQMSGQTQFHGPLYVTGKVSGGNGAIFNSDVYVKGDFSPGYATSTYRGNGYIGGTFGEVNPNSLDALPDGKKFYLKKTPSSSLNSSKFEINTAAVNAALSGTSWDLPAALKPENFSSLGFDYPYILKDDPVFDSWERMSKSEFAAKTGMNPTTCALNVSPSVKTVIRIDVATVIDLSDCEFSWANGDITFILNADVAILAKKWRSDGASNGNSFLTVRASGVGPVAAVRPKMHIIVPASQTQATNKSCSANAGAGDLTFTNLKFTQTGFELAPSDPSISTELVLYSSGSLLIGDVKAKPIYAQLYGCAVTAWSSLQITYSPPSENSQNLMALQTVELRDITD